MTLGEARKEEGMAKRKMLSAFADMDRMFTLGEPVLPNDFRRWGVTTWKEARELVAAFREFGFGGDDGIPVYWDVEERPYKCRVEDPVTGEVGDGEVTAFYGKLDRARRRKDDA